MTIYDRTALAVRIADTLIKAERMADEGVTLTMLGRGPTGIPFMIAMGAGNQARALHSLLQDNGTLDPRCNPIGRDPWSDE